MCVEMDSKTTMGCGSLLVMKRTRDVMELLGEVYGRIKSSPETMCAVAETCLRLARSSTNVSQRDFFLDQWARYTPAKRQR